MSNIYDRAEDERMTGCERVMGGWKKGVRREVEAVLAPSSALSTTSGSWQARVSETSIIPGALSLKAVLSAYSREHMLESLICRARDTVSTRPQRFMLHACRRVRVSSNPTTAYKGAESKH